MTTTTKTQNPAMSTLVSGLQKLSFRPTGSFEFQLAFEFKTAKGTVGIEFNEDGDSVEVYELTPNQILTNQTTFKWLTEASVDRIVRYVTDAVLGVLAA